MKKIEELEQGLKELVDVVGVDNVEKLTKVNKILKEVKEEMKTTDEKMTSLTDKYLELCKKVEFDKPTEENSNEEVEKTLDDCLNDILKKRG